MGSEPYEANLLVVALKETLKQNKTKCYNCDKLGHLRKDCRKNRMKEKKKRNLPRMYVLAVKRGNIGLMNVNQSGTKKGNL